MYQLELVLFESHELFSFYSSKTTNRNDAKGT